MSKQTETLNHWRLSRDTNGGFALSGIVGDDQAPRTVTGVILFDPVNKAAETYDTIYTLGDQHPDDVPKKAK